MTIVAICLTCKDGALAQHFTGSVYEARTHNVNSWHYLNLGKVDFELASDQGEEVKQENTGSRAVFRAFFQKRDKAP